MHNNQAIPFNKENFKQILSKQFAWVIVVSVPGALIAEYFNVPLAWFLGPMLVTSIVTLNYTKNIDFKSPLSKNNVYRNMSEGQVAERHQFPSYFSRCQKLVPLYDHFKTLVV